MPTDPLPSQPKESLAPKEKKEAPLTLSQIEELSGKRKLETKEVERREDLMQIRDGLQTLHDENPKLKIEQFYRQVEGLAPSEVEALSNAIFDIFSLSEKGVGKFNQLVDGNKTAELSSLIYSGVSFLDRCYRSYHAGKDVLSALEKNLQDLNSAPMPLLIQAKPGVIRILVKVEGTSFTWDYPGTLSRKAASPASAPKIIPEEPEAEEDMLESVGVYEEQEPEIDEEELGPQAQTPHSSGFFEGAENDDPAQRAGRWKEFLRQNASEKQMGIMKGGILEDKAGVLSDEEKAGVDSMSYEELVDYATGPYLDTLVEKNPEYLMEVDG